MAEEVLEKNDEFLKSLEEIERKAVGQKKEYDEARQEHVVYQRRIALAIEEIADVRRTAAEREENFRGVIQRIHSLKLILEMQVKIKEQNLLVNLKKEELRYNN